jgi:release factor glutamine methyltransferase
MQDTDTWTIGRLLNWTTDYFTQNGLESARLDAEVLLAEARGCQRIELYTAFDEVANEQTRVAFRELVRRRAEGMPVAYLVGRREFYAMTFQVNSNVLIPRPETEFVIVALLDLVKQQSNVDQELQIADVGTGSGIIAVCAATQLPNARVTAIDKSARALDVAQRNADNHQVADRIEFLHGDLLTEVPGGRRFAFVVSNPPYVTVDEFDELATEIREHEPREALIAGVRGTEIIERLVEQSAELLTADGWLIFEISPMIADGVRELIEANSKWRSCEVVKDLAGHERVVKAQIGTD